MRPTYRADIDGLRALAVLPILLFHAGVPGFSGGYVGVDIFFVISGYLITGIVANDLADGRFSIRTFYIRRIRRIFPALFAMLAAVGIAGWFLLFPLDLQRLGASLVATVGFFANVQAWMQSGYFDPASDTKPLLHTWSLAVEEQFYMFFPLVLVLCRRWLLSARGVVWGLAVASLAASVVWLRVDMTATFYLIPTRAWELMAGALVALGGVPRLTSPKAREGAAALGLAAILAPVFLFDDVTRFPAEGALLPCLGTALVIHAGGAERATAVERLLSVRGLVLVGLASYSLYLWHWPIIVFAHHLIVRDFTGPERAALVMASLAAGFVSWRLIEMPFRRMSGPRETFIAFGSAGAAMALFAAVGLAMIPTGFPQRYSPEMRALIDQIEVPDTSFEVYKGNSAYAGFPLTADGFVAGKGGGPAEVAVWGDSHVGMVLPAVAAAIDSGAVKAVTIFAKGGCRPVAETFIGYDADLTCRDHNRAVLDYLKTSPERRVVLVSRWGISLYGDVTPEGLGNLRPSLARVPGEMMRIEDAEAVFRQRLGETLDALTAAGKEVVLVEPFAEIPFEGKRMVFRAKLADPGLAALDVPIAPYEMRYTRIEALFDAVLSGRRVTRIAPRRAMCPEGRCILYRDGIIRFADNNHLTWGAAKLLTPLLMPALSITSTP